MGRWIAGAAVALAVAACGSAQQSTGAGPSIGPPAVAPTHASGPASTPNPGGTSALVLSDQDNNRSITIQRGTHLTVELASTYWTFAGSSNAAVLRPAGRQQTQAGANCVPGGGCGSASMAFEAVAAGTASITASRSSCGEAKSCTGAEGQFRVDVVVKG